MKLAPTLLVFATSTASAHGTAHYSLENGKIVVDVGGVLEDVPVDCEETHDLVQFEGNLYVACGPRGIAVYSIADPTSPKLAGRNETAPCKHLAPDGACSAVARPVVAPRVVVTDPKPDVEQPTETTKKRSWYGWQTLVSDAVAVVALFPFVFPGIGAYAFGAPIIHWVHGNVGAGFASLGLRVGGGTLVGVGAAVSSAYGTDNDAVGGVMIAFGIAALVAAPILDAAYLAYDEPEPKVSITPFGISGKF
jgi:hypothetical protein